MLNFRDIDGARLKCTGQSRPASQKKKKKREAELRTICLGTKTPLGMCNAQFLYCTIQNGLFPPLMKYWAMLKRNFIPGSNSAWQNSFCQQLILNHNIATSHSGYKQATSRLWVGKQSISETIWKGGESLSHWPRKEAARTEQWHKCQRRGQCWVCSLMQQHQEKVLSTSRASGNYSAWMSVNCSLFHSMPMRKQAAIKRSHVCENPSFLCFLRKSLTAGSRFLKAWTESYIKHSGHHLVPSSGFEMPLFGHWPPLTKADGSCSLNQTEKHQTAYQKPEYRACTVAKI